MFLRLKCLLLLAHLADVGWSPAVSDGDVGDSDLTESVRVLVPGRHRGSQTVQDTLPVLGEPLVSGDDENVETREDLPASPHRGPGHRLLLRHLPGLPGPVSRGQWQQTLGHSELLAVILALLHLSAQQLREPGRQEVGGPLGQTLEADTVQYEAVGEDGDSVGQTEQVVHGAGGGRAHTDHRRLQGRHVPAVSVSQRELSQETPALTLYGRPQ